MRECKSKKSFAECTGGQIGSGQPRIGIYIYTQHYEPKSGIGYELSHNRKAAKAAIMVVTCTPLAVDWGLGG